MAPLKTIKKVQQLNGQVATLNKILSRSAYRCCPFFQLLRSADPKIHWTKECEAAFNSLKEQLVKLPKLRPPKLREPLTFYAASFDSMINAVLFSEEEGQVGNSQSTQCPIYYLPRALQGVEVRYSTIEKSAITIVVAACRFFMYFQAHGITFPISYPVLQVLRKLDMSGCSTKWAIELSEFDAKFTLAKTIKGQALTNFIAEMTLRPESDLKETWTMHIDGSATRIASRVGMVLTNQVGKRIEHRVHFTFPATNNIAEYEALLARIRITNTICIAKVRMYIDSQLVA